MQPSITQQIPLPTPLPSTLQTVQTVQTTVQTAPEQPSSDDQDPAECFAKRRLRALQLTSVLFAHSLVVFCVGLGCATLTSNIVVTGFYPGIILTFGAFLGLVGMFLQENRRHMLMGAIIFISLGIIAAFFCAIIDGFVAGMWIDSQPVLDGSCTYYGGFAYQIEVTCASQLTFGGCKMKVRTNTCYCCYRCESPLAMFDVFEGVTGCWDVVHLDRLLWVSVVLNVIAVCLGIVTAALLGAYKDLNKPSLHATPYPPSPPPHILYNPTQHMMTYPMQHYASHPVMHTPQYHPEGHYAAADLSQGPGLPPPPPPPHPPAQPLPPGLPHPEEGGPPHPGLYALTPDAPVLYAAAYGHAPFVKPPPYAY